MPTDHLTEDTIRTIERLHLAWIDCELAGDPHGLLACCSEDIELRPPDGLSVFGRDAILAHITKGNADLHSIEITDRQIFGSSERVSLIAKYRTTFSVAEDPALREATGSHRWELRKDAGRWLVFLVSWAAATDQVDWA
jgi:ketosteroid isomerase-like protein